MAHEGSLERAGLGVVRSGDGVSTRRPQYPAVELHGDDGALVALVLPRAVAELCDPALGAAVGRARVHEPVDHLQADHRVRVPVHRLETEAAVDVPGLDGCVGAGGEEDLAGGVCGHGGDGTGVATELFDASAGLEAPGTGRHVGAARDEHVPGIDVGAVVIVVAKVFGGDEDERINAFAVALECPDTRSLLIALSQLRHVKEPGFGRLIE